MKKIKVGKVDVFYREKGKGKALLVLHGWDKSAKVFAGLQNILSQYYRVLIPDLPSFGQSSLPPKAWGVGDYAHFVKDFSHRLDLKEFYLLGHSFGGRVAIEFASYYPDLIEKLVLTGVPVLRCRKGKRLVFWLLAKIANLVFLIPPFFLLKKPFRRLLYRLAGEHDYQQTRGLKRKIFQKAIQENQLNKLKRIKAPTLVIWGEADRLTPLEHAREIIKRIPQSKLKIIPGATHKLPYERPKEFGEKLIQFLREPK